MRIASITIARSGSRRLPGKNVFLFAGRPLVSHKVWQLQKCPSIDQVVVGSDDSRILAAARDQGAIVLERAEEYCDEVSRPWNDVIVDMVSRVDADLILWAHCTNPCIRPETYERAIAQFRALDAGADSLVGVSEIRNHFWLQGASRPEPISFKPYRWARDVAEPHSVAADVAPLYFQNGGLFIARRVDMLKWRYVFGPHARLFVIGKDEATDIDNLEDMKRAQEVYGRQRQAFSKAG